MIWARRLHGTDGFSPLWARLRLPPEGVAMLAAAHEEYALVTGLDGDAKELLAELADAAWVAASEDAALLRASPASCEAWAARLGGSPLGVALERLATARKTPPATKVAGAEWSWGERTRVMGIVNVTPDSFSDGGALPTPEAAVAHGQRLVDEGADLLDVGGESTRPGATPVSADEELRRVIPVLEGLRARLPAVPLSIDTSKPQVARAALAAGAGLVNDVTGLADEAMLEVLAGSGAAACVMHVQGTPATMQAAPRYDDLVAEVLELLEARLLRAEKAGVARSQLWVDPGIGFGKTAAHNLFLVRRLGDLRLLGCPVVLGASRKAFLGELTGGKPPAERGGASAALAAIAAAEGGVDVVRVHDVAATREALAVADAVRAARDGGVRFAS